MNIFLNGTSTQIDDAARLSDLIAGLALAGQRFAVEVNAELIPRSCHADHPLQADDRVEIIHAVGGG